MAWIEESDWDEWEERKRREGRQRAAGARPAPPADYWRAGQGAPLDPDELRRGVEAFRASPPPLQWGPPQQPRPTPGAQRLRDIADALGNVNRWMGPSTPSPALSPDEQQAAMDAMPIAFRPKGPSTPPNPATSLLGPLEPGLQPAENAIGGATRWFGENVDQPSAEVLWGEGLRQQGRDRRNIADPTEIRRRTLAGPARFAGEVFEHGPGEAWRRAGERWRGSDIQEPLKTVAELSTPAQIALGVAPLERLPGAIAQGARALPGIARAAAPVVRKGANALRPLAPGAAEAAAAPAKGAIGDVLSRTPPEAGGAVLGGLVYQDDPNLSPQENAQRRILSAGAGALGGAMLRKGRSPGGTVEDAGKGFGRATKATGADPNRAYEFRYRVVDLDELVPSHTDRLALNAAFPQELQPRLRDRAASELQVDEIARTLNPDALLSDTLTLDRGPMIVGPDAVVESGNGRVLALRRARAQYPEQFAAYQERLAQRLPEYGIDPQATAGMKNPVLVRERVTDVDRPAFAREANEPATMAMSPFETARQDAGRISDNALGWLEVGESQGIDQSLRSPTNRPVVEAFIRAIPSNEQAALVDASGALNPLGLQRLKAGLFAKVYAGEAGQRLAQVFTESLDVTVKQIEAGLFGSLPQIARAEGLIRTGQRAAELSIAEDVSKAVDVLARLREQGMRVDVYLGQRAMWERDLTPFQESLLGYITAIGRSPKKVREFLAEYADAVERAPVAGQQGLFGDVPQVTKEDIVNGIIRRTADDEAARSPLFAAGERAAAEAPQAAATAKEGQELAGRVLEPPASDVPAGAPVATLTLQEYSSTVHAERAQRYTSADKAYEEAARVYGPDSAEARAYKAKRDEAELQMRSSLAQVAYDREIRTAIAKGQPYNRAEAERLGIRQEPPAPQPPAALESPAPALPERLASAPVPQAPTGPAPATPPPAQRLTPPRPAPQGERVIPEPRRPSQPLPRMFEENPPVREQGGLPGLEGTERPRSFTPPAEQGRLPGEPGRVPPRTPEPPADMPSRPAPPPDDGLLPRFPSNEELEIRTMQGGWVRRVESLIARVPGGKRVVGVVDPWAAAATHVERIPLVFRQMGAMGGDIVKTAMSQLEAIRLPGVKIKDGYFVEGVKPRSPGLSMAVSDVLENIGKYNVTPELAQFTRTANALNDDLVRWAKQEGVKLNQLHIPEGGHYFGRLVREVRDVEKRGGVRPDMPRSYDTMEAGMDAGVVYSDDLLATAEAGYSWLVRKITGQRMKQYAAELGRTSKQLVDPDVKARAVEAVGSLRTLNKYEATLRQLRDGMSPYFTVRTPGAAPGERLRATLTGADQLRPGLSKQVVEAWRKVQDLAPGDPARAQAFREMLEDAKAWRTKLTTEAKTARDEYSRALRSLQSPEYASAAQFGMPPGTIGVGPVHQAWAAGRAFPRETAKFLNEQFGESAHKILDAMSTVSGASRTLIAGFDFGATQIQLQGVMFSRPKIWAKAFGNMFAATANPQVLRAYMAHPNTQAVLKTLVPHGLTIEGSEFVEAIGRGGLLERAAGKLGPRVGGAIKEQVLGRAEAAFQAPLNVGKIELAKALLPTAEKAGQLDELAMFLNGVTGTRSSLAAGIGAGQRSIEGAAVFFSPRFTRSALAILGDALQGGLKGREARRALASLMAGSALVTGGLRLALGQQVTPSFFDPSSPDFQTVELFGRRVGFGGPYRATAVALGNSYKAARQDPSLFLDPLDRRENPLTRWWASRTAPATSLLWDVVERRDFLGEPLADAGAWGRRIGGMGVPFPAQEFALQEPGQKPPEALSLIPEMLGLRAVPLSPAMERDRLRDSYAQQEHGAGWDDLDAAKQAALERQHPDLLEARKGAVETYARRGSVLHQYSQDKERLRERPQAEIVALTEQLRRGEISGYDYRQAVQEREAEIAKVGEQLRRLPQYKEIPDKEEEWQAWAERHGYAQSERQSPVDLFLDRYYELAADLRDPKTGELNPAELVRRREALKAQYPADVVKEATSYINRNRAPELVQAQSEFAEYMALPKYRGLSKAQGEEADRIARFVAAYSKELGSSERAKALASQVFGQRFGWYMLSRKKEYANPERAKFRKEHPLIDKFYSRQSTVEFRELEPALAGR